MVFLYMQGISIFWFFFILVINFNSRIIFFALIYKTILQIFLAIPSIIGMSQFFYGTQVRYALASLVIVYAVINISKPILKIFTIIVASFIHYGGIIIGIIGLLSGKLNDNLFTINKLKPFLALIFLLLFSFFAFQNFDYLVSLTRFYYYINSGEFVERISLVSLLYIIFSLIILVVLFTLSKENRTQSVKIAILTLLFSLFASPIAALSGRISLFYFVFEPVLLGSLLITTGGRFFKFALFILYLVRVIFYIYVNEFYFYS